MYLFYQEKDKSRAGEYIKIGLQQFLDTESIDFLMLSLDGYCLEQSDYLEKQQYEFLLKEIYQKVVLKGQYLLQVELEEKLLECYRYNRKYKEAYLLLEKREK